jgi:hypothetical protein
MGLLRIGTHGSKLHALAEFNSMTMVITDCKSGAFMFVDCAQIVPVKVKFSQIFPKISKITDKISCIISTLKSCSFLSKLFYDLKSLGTSSRAGSIPAIGTIKINSLTASSCSVICLYIVAYHDLSHLCPTFFRLSFDFGRNEKHRMMSGPSHL